MAKAEKRVEKVNKVVKVEKVVTEEQVVGVTLELSVEEAMVVKHLVGSVGGLGKYRDATTRVYDALSWAGVRNTIYDLNGNFKAGEYGNYPDYKMPENPTLY